MESAVRKIFKSIRIDDTHIIQAFKSSPGYTFACFFHRVRNWRPNRDAGSRAVQRRARISSAKTQRRLRELVEVLTKVEPRFGSELLAYAWYRSDALHGFDGRTAMQLVQEGKAQQVPEFVDAGVFARSALAETWDAEMS